MVLAGAAFAAITGGVLARAGMTRQVLAGMGERVQGRRPRTLLRVWDWWSPSTSEKYTAYFGEVEREFERENPDVDLVLQFVPFTQYEQKMATGLVGATPPDVFQSSVVWAGGFYARGMLLPLNGYLERERRERAERQARGEAVDPGESVYQDQFLEPAWRHNTAPDGTVYGIPQTLDASCLMWNLDLLRQAAEGGNGAPGDPEIRGMFLRKADGTVDWSRLRFDAVKDWAQFRRIVKRLSRYDAQGNLALDGHGDPVQAGFTIHAHGTGGGAAFMPWLAANGGLFQDDAGTRTGFAEPPGVEAMQFLNDLYWKDHVSPPFRRQLADDEVFNQGHVACAVNGTWAGKYIVRNTEGRLRFDGTPFPPGPRGSGQATLAWGNMLVITRRSPHPEVAWRYVKFITGRKGALRLLRLVDLNSPRKDFYESPEWRRACEERPYLWNVPAIAACGRRLRSTQVNAVDFAAQPIFETLLLRYPEIAAGKGPYPSVEAGLRAAAGAVDRVYGRYQEQVAYWRRTSARLP